MEKYLVKKFSQRCIDGIHVAYLHRGRVTDEAPGPAKAEHYILTLRLSRLSVGDSSSFDWDGLREVTGRPVPRNDLAKRRLVGRAHRLRHEAARMESTARRRIR